MTAKRFDIETSRGIFAAIAVGDHDAPLILCLHGFPDHPPSFVPFATELAGRGFRVVMPWLRGYAPSPTDGPVDVSSLRRDAGEMLVELTKDSSQTFVVGHDWGAVITYALLASKEVPVAAACALSVPHPVAFVKNAIRSPAQLVRSRYMVRFQRIGADDEVAKNDYAAIRDLWAKWSPGYRMTAESWRELRQTLAASGPRPLDYYRQLPRLSTLKTFRTLRQTRIATPMTTIFGDRDGCIDADMANGSGRYFSSEFALEVMEGVGHFIHLEAPAELASRVALRLRSARAARSVE